MDLPVYLLMVSYKRTKFALKIVEDYLTASKPNSKCKFLIIENTEEASLKPYLQTNVDSIIYHHCSNKNKAAMVNFAVERLVKEKEALIIHIDNDIRFKKDFIIKYYNTAVFKGTSSYFGSSFVVNYPKEADPLIPYLNASAVGKSDEHFLKMKKLMFLGFSYCFFKSQWERVSGLDERFSPGSKYNLAAEESIFQKKMMNVGYVPYFISNNQVEHKPEKHNYSLPAIFKRNENNGYTHGFQSLILSKQFLKTNYFKRLCFYWKLAISTYLSEGKSLNFKVKTAYAKGFFKAAILFVRIKDKSSYLNF